jgi:tetrahydromethanopterin S-methyltransferase subunit B
VVTVELSCEELEMVCDVLTTRWIEINEKFVFMAHSKAAERMRKLAALEDKLRARLGNEPHMLDPKVA